MDRKEPPPPYYVATAPGYPPYPQAGPNHPNSAAYNVGWQQEQPQYQATPQYAAPPNPPNSTGAPYPNTTYVVTSQPAAPTTNVIFVGNCPKCHVGTIQEDFTCCGICCGIIFFPVGLLCTLLMRERRCNHCHAEF